MLFVIWLRNFSPTPSPWLLAATEWQHLLPLQWEMLLASRQIWCLLSPFSPTNKIPHVCPLQNGGEFAADAPASHPLSISMTSFFSNFSHLHSEFMQPNPFWIFDWKVAESPGYTFPSKCRVTYQNMTGLRGSSSWGAGFSSEFWSGVQMLWHIFILDFLACSDITKQVSARRYLRSRVRV